MAPLFLTLTLAATATGPACAEPMSLEASLAQVEHQPLLRGYASAASAQAGFGDRISRLHGQTSAQLTPGVRWFPFDQLRPEGNVGLQHSAVIADLGGARRRVNDAEVSALAARADAELVERRLAVAVRWVQLWSAQEGVALADKQLEAARALEEKLIGARALNASSQAELLWARTRRQRRQLELIDAEGEVSEAGLALASAIGCAAPAELRVIGTPWSPPSAKTAAPTTDSAAAAALRAHRTAVRERQALAALKQRPTASLGLSAEVDGANTVRTLVGLGGSWSLFEGDYVARGQTAAEEALLTAQLDHVGLEQRHLFAALAHEIEHQGEVITLVEEQLLPDLRALEAVHQTAFDVGEATLADLAQAKSARVDAERNLLTARQRLGLAVVRARIWSGLEAPPAVTTARAAP
jgi:outer membrane protein TolC